jgi:signal transduction histidine kinase
MQENIDASACREVIGSMLEEADRLTRLVDSLLTLSRADAGSILFNREKTDLSALAVEVGDCLQVLAEEKEQNLTIVAPGPVFAEVDRPTLRQAIINLLDNAIKYTPAGGAIRVAVSLTAANEAIIAVSDNGPGIASEHQQMVYERFYRVDKGRSREVGGAGLGLSIARWAVEANNGSLELESTVGVGCTFRVLLPGLIQN